MVPPISVGWDQVRWLYFSILATDITLNARSTIHVSDMGVESREMKARFQIYVIVEWWGSAATLQHEGIPQDALSKFRRSNTKMLDISEQMNPPQQRKK